MERAQEEEREGGEKHRGMGGERAQERLKTEQRGNKGGNELCGNESTAGGRLLSIYEDGLTPF